MVSFGKKGTINQKEARSENKKLVDIIKQKKPSQSQMSEIRVLLPVKPFHFMKGRHGDRSLRAMITVWPYCRRPTVFVFWFPQADYKTFGESRCLMIEKETLFCSFLEESEERGTISRAFQLPYRCWPRRNAQFRNRKKWVLRFWGAQDAEMGIPNLYVDRPCQALQLDSTNHLQLLGGSWHSSKELIT